VTERIKAPFYGTVVIAWSWFNPHPSGGVGCTRPLPGSGRGGIPRRPNSRATLQRLDQRSKLEKVVPKMARRRDTDADCGTIQEVS